MPKKTKKQKLLAEIHRQKMAEKGLSYNFVKPPSEEPIQDGKTEAGPKITKKENIAVKPQNTALASEYNYLKRDLTKIFLFTFFALFSQGVVYYLVYRP
ncbi:hypothetical protein A2W14_06685 [Candidatus Gottesmanbacteria bacterium RBG_16_37_8]|uniref:Uncharacterized protein n=1 Tax=Candidatus Gottesmanbacteria bacterium RBG_16_37_8 TaxID=1798371 RepID=A0A1F5YRT7_9BACT|nr:MAG: hypothetical protein A2W14_06685 [Candidatus Gottesmanbacteria bacterium RBG_16_37_8]